MSSNNDGFDLGAQRREIKGSEIPDVINIFKDYQAGKDVADRENVVLAKKTDIAGQDYILVGERYRVVRIDNAGYPIVRLGDVCTINDQSKDPSDMGKFIYVDISAVDGDTKKINYTNFVSGVDAPSRARRLFKQGDVLLSTVRPNLKAFAYVDREDTTNCIASTGFAVIRCGSSVDSKYLYYLLLQDSLVNQMIGMMGKGAYPSINQTDVSNLRFPLPPLTVQEEIVAEIESYQRIIDGARQVVENYKPRIKIDPTWEKKAIGEVCKTASGGTPTSTNRAYYENGTINWLKSGEVSKGFIYSTEEHITEKALQESAAKLFPVDTVVIAMYGATAGQVGILKTESTTNQAICGIYPNEYYLPEFIYFYLKSKRDYFLSQSTGGAQPNISQLTIKKTMIPSVPIEQQRVIVDAIREEMSIVEQNKRLIEIFQQKIKDKIAEVWGE